ncbi:MAG TPA: SDR family oxidoreductase [Alphaproteobacteria bacterium]|nr:SDR family oxidoreductase [Alphaproteobacteria bacterium]
MRLAGKVALITGGGTGMGRATAALFHKEGAKVAIAGRRQGVLKKAARAIGEDVLALPCDVTNEPAVIRLVENVVAEFGRIDVLVNCAGINPSRADIAETDLKAFRDTIEASATGSFLAARAAIPAMPNGGSIVLIGSAAATRGWPMRFSVTAAKGAVHAMTRQLARSLGKDGIRVNLVSPGATRTEMTQALFEAMSEDAYARLIAETPLGRVGEAEDIANACLFLASDESSYITGAILPVDGGQSA